MAAIQRNRCYHCDKGVAFGFHVRRVLLFACDTLLPKATPLSQW